MRSDFSLKIQQYTLLTYYPESIHKMPHIEGNKVRIDYY